MIDFIEIHTPKVEALTVESVVARYDNQLMTRNELSRMRADLRRLSEQDRAEVLSRFGMEGMIV